MKREIAVFLLFLLFETGCSSPKPKVEAVSSDIKKVQDLMTQGNYDDALKLTKDIADKTMSASDTPAALYLEGYILAFDKSDFQNSRSPLRKLLETYPQSIYVIPSQKIIADTQYWQGHYNGAIEEYKKLAVIGNSNLVLYAKLQMANSLLLEDKVDEALNHYRELIEKNPNTPIADSAQLMIANAYLKLQNISQAKKELKNLIAHGQNQDIQESAQKALRQIEEDASMGQDSHISK